MCRFIVLSLVLVLLASGQTAYGSPPEKIAFSAAVVIHAQAIVNAASCSQPDVQAAVDAAQNGDTVQVPAGQCDWLQPVRIVNKAITLKGAGIESTVITDKTGNAWNEPALWIEGQDGQSIRATGFTFRYAFNGTLQDYNGAIVVRGTSKTVRIDHCKFVDFWNRAINISGYTYGVVDHCVFELTLAATQDYQAVNASGDSNAAWERPLTLGSANAFYIEDNVIDYSIQRGGSAADSHSGGRFVFRMNTIHNAYMLNHGLDTSDRSSHSFEIYENRFSWDAYAFNAITIRGGTGVIFHNTMTNPATVQNPIIAQYYRSCLDYPSTHGVRCNGTNPIDGNQEPTGYPCKDQHGRTTGQQLSPIYVWDNVLNATTANMRLHDPWGCTNPSMADHVKEGRDYYNGVYRPRYVPYPYPHPLTLADYPGQQRALALQGQVLAGQAHLSWQAITGAVSYRILRDWNQAGAIITTNTSYQEALGAPERIYMVYALDGGGKILAAEGVLLVGRSVYLPLVIRQ